MAAKEATPSFANVGREITGKRGSRYLSRGHACVRACARAVTFARDEWSWPLILNESPAAVQDRHRFTAASTFRWIWPLWNSRKSVGLCCGGACVCARARPRWL